MYELKYDEHSVTAKFTGGPIATTENIERRNVKLIVGFDRNKKVVSITVFDPPRHSSPKGSSHPFLAPEYDVKADALGLNLTPSPHRQAALDSLEVWPDLIVDFDGNERVVGLEFLNASTWFSGEMLQEFNSRPQIAM